jgi:chromosome segregation ATPase
MMASDDEGKEGIVFSLQQQIKSLTYTNEKLRGEAFELQESLAGTASLKKQLSKAQKKIEVLNQENKLLSSQVYSLSVDNAKLKDENAFRASSITNPTRTTEFDTSSQLTVLQSQLQAAQQENEKQKEDNQRLQESLSIIRERHKQEVQTRDSLIQRLKAEVLSFKETHFEVQNIESLKRKLGKARAQVNKLEDQVEELRHESEAQKKKYATVKHKYHKARRDADSVSARWRHESKQEMLGQRQLEEEIMRLKQHQFFHQPDVEILEKNRRLEEELRELRDILKIMLNNERNLTKLRTDNQNIIDGIQHLQGKFADLCFYPQRSKGVIKRQTKVVRRKSPPPRPKWRSLSDR